MKKRLLSLMLALLLVLTLVPALKIDASAAESSWLWPVPSSTTQNQGWSAEHGGIDIGGTKGCDVVASKSGTVFKVLVNGETENKNWVGYGNGVIINHGGGVYSHYAHLNSTCVSVGQSVSQGQKIGEMGTTGNSTGVHLHFAIKSGSQGPYGGPGGSINNDKNAMAYIYGSSQNPPAGAMNLGNTFYAAIIFTSPWYHLESNGSNVYITHNNAAIAQQHWRFDRQSDGSYIITSEYDGKVLDVYNGEANNGQNVWVYQKWGEDNAAQRWYIFGNATAYELVPKLNTSMRLDVASGGTAEGTNIQLATCNNSINQTFSIYKVDGPGPSKITVKGNSDIKVGETTSLSVDYGNAVIQKSVKWTSSDNSVATVDSSGVVKGNSAGTATIKAVANFNNNVYSSIKITVSEALKITKQPSNLKAASGKTGKFAVTASGDGLKYQWQYQKPGTTTWVNSTATSGKTASFTVNAREAINGYKYRCKVTDASGNSVTSGIATLAVTPGITKQPANIKVQNGTTGKLTITAAGDGLSYQWQYQKPGTTTWVNSTASSGKTASFSINAREAIDGYKYRCVVKNSCGNSITSSVATLTVVYDLAITKQPTNLTAASGTTGKLKITAVGTGLSYQWQYQKPGTTTWVNSTASSGKTASFSINVREAIDGYKYRCIVKDANGDKVTSNIVKLTVT